MSAQQYTVDYFIGKFEAIPEGQWCTGDFERDGKCCAGGHCGHRINYSGEDMVSGFAPEYHALIMLFERSQRVPVLVNDGSDPDYPQPDPRARILAALRDIRAKGAA